MLEQLVLLTLKDIGKENGTVTQNLHNSYTPSRTRSNIDTDVTVMIALNDLLIFICLLVVVRMEILKNLCGTNPKSCHRLHGRNFSR